MIELPAWLPDSTGLVQLATVAGIAFVAADTITGGKAWGWAKGLWDRQSNPVGPEGETRPDIDEAFGAIETLKLWGKDRNDEFDRGLRLLRDNFLSDKTLPSSSPPAESPAK